MLRLSIVVLALAVCLLIPAYGQEGCNVAVSQADAKSYAEALRLYEAHSYKEAAQKMRRVASRNPQSADPQYWLGMMAVKDGYNATAIRRYFSRCISLCPSYPEGLAHYYMGVIHYTDEHYEEAVDEFNQYFARANDASDRSLLAVYEEASNYLHWSQFLMEASLNTAPFDPHKVEAASSKHPEAMPYFTLDGREVYFLRQLPAKREVTVYSQEFEVKQWKLYSSRLDTMAARGKELPAPFNQGDQEGSVTLTADGSVLYYSKIKGGRGYANSDLYRVRHEAGTWQSPEPLGALINGERSWEAQPSVSPDGSTLYFASNREGGYGGIDIWRCRRLKNGDWSRPENLGSAINSAGNEKFPFIAADGYTLYFLSDGWQGFGGYDVYMANLNDPFANRPTNLGLPINSEGDEGPLGVTPDGKRAYYAGRLDGSASTDVLIFDLYPAAQPEPMCWAAITVKTPTSQEADVVLSLTRQGAPTAVYVAHSDVPTAMMLSMREDNLVVATANGMLPEVMVVTATDAARGKRLPKEVQLKPMQVGTRIPIPRQATRLWLEGWKQYLIDNPRVHLQIEYPHKADAKEVYDYFVGSGLRAERFVYRGGTDVETPQFIVQ